MEHSLEYQKFTTWLHASVREKMDGYSPDLLAHIYEWERDELEDIIWEQFNHDFFTELACFLPQLTRYDGIGALKGKLSEYQIPSSGSRLIAKVLYEATDDDSYLDVFKANYEKSKDDRYQIVSELSYCKPGQKMFDMLCDFYLNSDEKLTVQTAAWGIVFYINGVDPLMPISEQMEYIPIIRQLTECGRNERAERLKTCICEMHMSGGSLMKIKDSGGIESSNSIS